MEIEIAVFVESHAIIHWSGFELNCITSLCTKVLKYEMWDEGQNCDTEFVDLLVLKSNMHVLQFFYRV